MMPSVTLALHRHTLVTVGYEGRSAQELVAAVVSAEIDVLVDVRLSPR